MVVSNGHNIEICWKMIHLHRIRDMKKMKQAPVVILGFSIVLLFGNPIKYVEPTLSSDTTNHARMNVLDAVIPIFGATLWTTAGITAVLKVT